jgi:hypothetical protein
MSYYQLQPGTTLADMEAKMLDIQRQHHVAGRTCGDCKECCTVLNVLEINKPINTPCPNCTAQGCGIYETRPLTCRGWSCEWWLGRLGLTDAQRPDKLGLMFTFEPGTPVIAYELVPGAATSKKGAKVLHRMRSQRTLLLQRYGTQQRETLRGGQPRDASSGDDLLGLGDASRGRFDFDRP